MPGKMFMNCARMMALACLSFLLAAACAACGSPVAEEVEKFPVGKATCEVIEIHPGERFQVVLDRHPVSDYTWYYDTEPDPAVVKQVGDVQVLNPRRAGLDTGAPGRQAWTFEAVAPGETEMIFENGVVGKKGSEAWAHDVIVDVLEELEPYGEEVEVYRSGGRAIEVPAGTEFEIDLSEDAGWNGYRWLLTTDYENEVVVFKGIRLTRHEGPPAVSFEERWRFRVVSKGRATLTFFQIEPWKEPAVPDEVRAFHVTGR